MLPSTSTSSSQGAREGKQEGEEVQTFAVEGENKNMTTEREREREEFSQGGMNTSHRFLSLFPHPSLQSSVQSERETLSCHYENAVCFHFLFVFCRHGSGK